MGIKFDEKDNEYRKTMDVEPIVRHRRQDGHFNGNLVKAIEKAIEDTTNINLKELLPYRESQGVYNEEE